MRHEKPIKINGRWTRAWQVRRPTSTAYVALYKDLVAFVDHYYYPMDSKEMKYLLGATLKSSFSGLF